MELKILCACPRVGLKLGETLAWGVTQFKGSRLGHHQQLNIEGFYLAQMEFQKEESVTHWLFV